jgi:hypothetical protein
MKWVVEICSCYCRVLGWWMEWKWYCTSWNRPCGITRFWSSCFCLAAYVLLCRKRDLVLIFHYPVPSYSSSGSELMHSFCICKDANCRRNQLGTNTTHGNSPKKMSCRREFSRVQSIDQKNGLQAKLLHYQEQTWLATSYSYPFATSYLALEEHKDHMAKLTRIGLLAMRIYSTTNWKN